MKLVGKADGIITVKTHVPLYVSRYSKTSNDPLERILRKLKKRFIANRGLTVTHLINRPRTNGGHYDTDEITIQFLISNFDGNLTSERIIDIRKEYAEVALKVLTPYVNYLVKNDISDETELDINALEEVEGLAIDKIKELVKETPELAESRREAEQKRLEHEKRRTAYEEKRLAEAGKPYVSVADPIYAIYADGFNPRKHDIRYMQHVLSEVAAIGSPNALSLAAPPQRPLD